MNRENLPLISIAVPVYNPNNRHFEECIESLRRQTYKYIEILLVDDGSDSQTALRCEEFARKDERIRVLHQINGGLSRARNKGIEMANGEYLVCVDSDDFVDDNMVMRGYEVLKRQNAQIVAWTYQTFSNKGNLDCYYKGADIVVFERATIWKYQAMMLDALYFSDIQFSLCMTTWGKMFSMELLKAHPEIRFNEKLRWGAEDNDFLLRLLEVTEKLVLFHNNMYHYRINEDNSQTTRFDTQYIEHEYEIAGVLKNDIKNEKRLNHAFQKYICNHVLMVCTNYLWHEKNDMTYRKRRKVLREVLEVVEVKKALRSISRRDFPRLKYIFMFGARYKLYDLMLLLSRGYLIYKK
ncbi:MAG: glycosyltransferase family 2 protein [Muribaculaceae bacterium]|nr:glycosyltransferase family 2 protein [Roseburia sp.]MCM1431224.1 glycosyltransferase family 2 protein [Muribaculaceae bacterium]MCM1492290.1 glycosyltransferase family 2 protein [Muribaculaceae bacterium]